MKPQAGIFALALMLRLVYLAEMSLAPTFDILVGDARTYDRWAMEIASGAWLGNDTFYQAPFYPYFLGVLYAVFGHSVWLVRIVQCVLGATACVLLAGAGEKFFSRRTGLLAGLLLAVYPPAIFFDGMIQKAGLDLLFMTLLLYLLGTIRSVRTLPGVAAVGVCLGCFCLTRENALALVPVVLAWLLIDAGREGVRRRGMHAAIFLLGWAIVLLPVGVRNLVVGGEFLLTTSQAGTNFFIGNNEQADGRHRPFVPGREMPEYEQGDATAIAEADVGRSLTPREVSDYFMDRAFDYIRTHPFGWSRLMVRKWLLVWNRHEIPDTESLDVNADTSWVLGVLKPFLHLGVLAPLAAAGVALTWSERRRLWLLYLAILSLAGAVAIFYVFARYRYPIVPPVLLFAAAGALGLWESVRLRRLAGVIGPLAVLVVVAVVTNWPVVRSADPRPMTYRNAAAVLLEDGRVDEAIRILTMAVEAAPELTVVRYQLAITLDRAGRADDAMTRYREVIRFDPDHFESLDNLGRLLVQRGNVDEAAVQFEASLRVNPDGVVARNNLGVVRNMQGREPEAFALFEEALEIDPGYSDARLNLVAILSDHGMYDEARSHLLEVLRRDPDHAGARRALERLGPGPS